MYSINATGAVSIAPPLTDDWTRLCEHGRELAQLDDRIQWELADLCERVRANGQYGTQRMSDFAREIDRKRTFVYDRAQLARFYLPHARTLINEIPTISFEKCLMIMRKTNSIDEAMQWLERIADDITYTADKLQVELDAYYEGKPKPTTPLYEGTYTHTQLRDVIDTLPTGEYRVRITKL